MNVTIIGTGNMAHGIATRLLAGGNNISIIGRTGEAAAQLVEELTKEASNSANLTAKNADDTIKDEVVVLAVWYHDAKAIVQEYGDKLSGKIIVDISNPLNETYDGLATNAGQSAAEEIASIAPTDAQVVKAFNTTFAGTLVAGQVGGQSLDVLIAGDDAAKATIVKLIESTGLRAVDVGPLQRAQQLEGLGLLHITIQSALGTNGGSTVKFVS